jgi:MFS family permease
MTSEARTGSNRGRLAVTMLAVSLLSVELLAGMQRYLSQTVLPLVASDLHGAHLYGVLDAAAQAPMFLTMPIGAWLLSRFRIGDLMLSLTLLTVVGAAVCALAPSMSVFIAGTAIRALASGALGTVGMGAISRGLPPKYRQLVLAGMSGVWVISSVIGPIYAVAISSLLGWRWAIVLYLPLLLLARMMIARYLPERTEESVPEKAPWTWSAVLAIGAVVLSLPIGVWSAVAVIIGGGLMLMATRELLPSGSFSASHGRRAGLSALLVTAAVYFGASMVLSVVAHDALGLEAREYGFIIAAPGFTWAIAGLWCGAHPAVGAAFRRRVLPAGVAIGVGVAAILATTLVADTEGSAFVGLMLGTTALGLGMGSLYPDLLGRCLTQPEPGDGISQDRMAAAVVLAETVGMALATTLAYTWLGSGFGLIDTPLHRSQILYGALVPLAALMVTRLAAASRSPA